MSNSPSPAPAGAESAPARDPMAVLDMQWEGDPGLSPDASAEDAGEEQPTSEPVEIEPETPEGGEGEKPEGDGQENEEPVDDATEPETDPKPSDDEETGTRMHRLRDGSQVSLSDLKKGYGDYQEFTQRVWPQIQQERARFQQEQQALTAQQQQFQPILAQVATILQGQIVPRPDPALRQNDPIEYFTQLDLHNESVARLQQVNQAQLEQQRATQHQQASQLETARLTALQQFVAHRPEYNDKAKADQFLADREELRKELGFDHHAMAGITHPGLHMLTHYAIIGKRTVNAEQQAKQVKTQRAEVAKNKVADKPPVTAPAARQTAGVREQTAARGSLERLRKSGSAADAEDFLSRYEP